MDTKFIDEMKGFMRTELQRIEIKGLSPFYVGPLTIKQAQTIQKEPDDMLRIARHFQVRARDENGKLLIPGGIEFDKFVAEAPLDIISDAVVKMVAIDSTVEDAEKNS